MHFWGKHYEEPSIGYGLNGCRISKLSLKLNGERIANYGRGRDIDATRKEAEIYLAILLNAYN
ncbi:DUF7678 domain-containing protein [Peptoniphilus sp. HCN-40583]|uniref:DUF7678 domain-containing protein n=1 Tax=Peptoniphilus sp. HCN-40583 TaxID=3134662 RepID=UPI004040AA79